MRCPAHYCPVVIERLCSRWKLRLCICQMREMEERERRLSSFDRNTSDSSVFHLFSLAAKSNPSQSVSSTCTRYTPTQREAQKFIKDYCNTVKQVHARVEFSAYDARPQEDVFVRKGPSVCCLITSEASESSIFRADEHGHMHTTYTHARKQPSPMLPLLWPSTQNAAN